MNIYRRQTSLGTLAFTLALALTTIQCGGSNSPNQPTTTPSVSGVSLTQSSTVVGTTAQGTVSLTVAAPAQGVTVSLSTSNSAVATVPLAVTVPPGASSATFTVTAMAAGTANITATFNGTSRSAAVTVTSAPATVAISLSAASVIGGNDVSGTVTLGTAAPAGGAIVSLTGGDPVTLPATVTVPAGLRTMTFTVATRVVGAIVTSTISAAYSGATASVSLSVTPPAANAATARFGVKGTSVTDTCQMASDGGSLICTFDGSTSTAPGTITAWDWTYSIAPIGTTISKTTTTPSLTMPSATCALLPAPPLPAGTTSFQLTVTLVIHDSLGNLSPVASDNGARVLPQGACGFPN